VGEDTFKVHNLIPAHTHTKKVPWISWTLLKPLLSPFFILRLQSIEPETPNYRTMSAAAMVLDPKPTPSSSEPPPTVAWTAAEATAGEDEDLYGRLKSLERHLEFIDIQEEYVKDELKNLKRELLRAQEEVKRIQSVTLVIGQFMEMVDQNNGIVGSTTGSNYYVRILSTINRELLKPSASVALHRHSNALVDVLPPEADSSISLLSQSEKPDVTYNVCLILLDFFQTLFFRV